jgi:RNA 2',3'-cyclic 3'-phosphodiesterase
MKETNRLFFALEINTQIRNQISDLTSRLKKVAQFSAVNVSWVPEENYHLTLFFLGNIPSEKAKNLADRLTQAVKEIPPFPLDFRHLGFFPNEPKQPIKVLWLGIHRPPDELDRLRQQCASIIAETGLPVPDQQFSPHITLGRFKSNKGVSAFRKMTKVYQFTKMGTCEVNQLVLMESITGDGPATYAPFASESLNK